LQGAGSPIQRRRGVAHGAVPNLVGGFSPATLHGLAPPNAEVFESDSRFKPNRRITPRSSGTQSGSSENPLGIWQATRKLRAAKALTGTYLGSLSLLLADRFDSVLKLAVLVDLCCPPNKFNQFVRLDGHSFKN